MMALEHQQCKTPRTLLFPKDEQSVARLPVARGTALQHRSSVEFPANTYPNEWWRPDILDCCGGLICCLWTSYRTGRQRVFVWNLSIRRCVEIVHEIGYGFNFWAERGIGIGFGFDNVCDDYRVVSVRYVLMN
ncbi:hypothetical protein Droror1_Dr00000531 [Drosera rotundifolia]